MRDELDELDIAEVEPFPQPEPDEGESLSEIPQTPIDEVVNHVRGILLGTMDFDRSPNTTHTDTDLIDRALDTCRERSELNPIITDNGHDGTEDVSGRDQQPRRRRVARKVRETE